MRGEIRKMASALMKLSGEDPRPPFRAGGWCPWGVRAGHLKKIRTFHE